MQNNIDTVIFDIGNVLMRFSWLEYVEPLWEPKMVERVTKAIFGDGRWDEMDRGIMNEEEIVRSFVAADPEIEKEILYTYDHCLDSLHRLDYAVPWVREVKEKGRKALYLSNYSRLLFEGKPEVLDFLNEMDGGVFSYRVGSIKPEARIYEILTQQYQLSPERCVFIDDRAENLEAAEAAGFQTILFTGYDDARKALDEKLRD